MTDTPWVNFERWEHLQDREKQEWLEREQESRASVERLVELWAGQFEAAEQIVAGIRAGRLEHGGGWAYDMRLDGVTAYPEPLQPDEDRSSARGLGLEIVCTNHGTDGRFRWWMYDAELYPCSDTYIQHTKFYPELGGSACIGLWEFITALPHETYPGRKVPAPKPAKLHW